jgi:hypothetical protein
MSHSDTATVHEPSHDGLNLDVARDEPRPASAEAPSLQCACRAVAHTFEISSGLCDHCPDRFDLGGRRTQGLL